MPALSPPELTVTFLVSVVQLMFKDSELKQVLQANKTLKREAADYTNTLNMVRGAVDHEKHKADELRNSLAQATQLYVALVCAMHNIRVGANQHLVVGPWGRWCKPRLHT